MKEIRTRRECELPFVMVTEAAERTGLSRAAIMAAINTGRLPVYRPSTTGPTKVWLVRVEDVEQLWRARMKPLPHHTEDINDLLVAATT